MTTENDPRRCQQDHLKSICLDSFLPYLKKYKCVSCVTFPLKSSFGFVYSFCFKDNTIKFWIGRHYYNFKVFKRNKCVFVSTTKPSINLLASQFESFFNLKQSIKFNSILCRPNRKTVYNEPRKSRYRAA